MSEVEFNYLSSKAVGNDCIVFRLEDGTQVIVRIDIMRAGFRVNDKGNKDYHFEFNNPVKVVPSDKKFKATVPIQPANASKGEKQYIQ